MTKQQMVEIYTHHNYTGHRHKIRSIALDRVHISLYDTPLLWRVGAQATSYNSVPHCYVTGYDDVDMGARESFPITLIRALFSSFILWFSFFTSCKLCIERERLDKYIVKGQRSTRAIGLVPYMQLLPDGKHNDKIKF